MTRRRRSPPHLSGVGTPVLRLVPSTYGPTTAAEHDLLLVRGAIDVIARGGARRVTLVTLHSPEAILPEAQAVAREHGVIVRAVWRQDGIGCDIAVEAVG